MQVHSCMNQLILCMYACIYVCLSICLFFLLSYQSYHVGPIFLTIHLAFRQSPVDSRNSSGYSDILVHVLQSFILLSLANLSLSLSLFVYLSFRVFSLCLHSCSLVFDFIFTSLHSSLSTKGRVHLKNTGVFD